MRIERKVAVQAERRSPGSGTIMDEFLAARSREAFAVYSELGDVAQKEVFERFRGETTHKSAQQARGVENAMIRSLFSTWLARDLWGEPTAQALARFIEQRGL